MKKTILSLVLAVSFVCTAIVPASAAFVSSTTLSTEIKSEVEMTDASGAKVEVETFTSLNREDFKTTKKPAIIVTSDASGLLNRSARHCCMQNCVQIQNFNECIHDLSNSNSLNDLFEHGCGCLHDFLLTCFAFGLVYGQPIVVSDYALVDIAYVEVNDLMQQILDEKKDENGELTEPPVVTVEIAGITAESEIIVVFIPDDSAAPIQTVESTVNEDGTFSFNFMANGTYMFLAKVV